ncbi:MAG: cytidylate kinase-like family protein [Myxococcota bacterium]|nr:cytidylate kinase-like family protein [Myxococcota bacterium]
MVPASAKVVSDRARILADRQMRRWELQHPAAGGATRPSPCVAISRLPGAGGAEVGQLVARWLDYGFFGEAIVDEIAREVGVDHWVVKGLDERVRTAIDRYLADTFTRRQFTEDDYLWHVSRTIATLGRRGSAVIVGRGAPFLLGREEALRVFLVAPRARRVERYARVKDLDLGRAEEALARAESRRADFAELQFGVRQDDPLLYDLVLNTASLGIEAAAGVVVETLRKRFPTPRT